MKMQPTELSQQVPQPTQPIKYLYIASADIGHADQVHLLYATDDADAQSQAQAWFQALEHAKQFRAVRRCPHGYTISMNYYPPTIPMPVQ